MSHFHYLSNIIPQSRMETATDVVAGAAMTSPWWLPYLKAASEEASLLLPLAGLILVIINAIARILVTRKALRDGRK